MNISADDLGPCKKLLRIEFDGSEVQQETDKIIQNYIRNVNLPGFRKGKAPKAVILRNYQKDIEREVESKLVDLGLKKASTDNGYRLVSVIDVEKLSPNVNGPFQFTANVEVEPSFAIPTYKGLRIEVAKLTVSESDIDRGVQALREQKASYEAADGPLEKDHFAVVDYSGTIDGTRISELVPHSASIGSGHKQWIKMDMTDLQPDFPAALLGHGVGSKVSIDHNFPDDFHVVEVQGKMAQYEVDVLEIKRRQLPELNDEFAQSFDQESIQSLREAIQKDMEADSEARLQKDMRNQLTQKIMESVNFDVPESLVENETRQIIYDIVYQNQKAGVSKEDIARHTDEIYASASASGAQRVRTRMTFLSIAEQEKIQVSQNELAQYITYLAANYQMKPEKLIKDLQEKNGVGRVVEDIKIAKLMDLLKIQNEIIEVPKSRSELNPADNAG